MNIRDLLTAERIVIPLPAKTLHDAAEQLIGSFVESGVATEASKLIARVTETPADEALTVGQDAFILHVRSASMDSVSAALGVTAEPMSLESESEKSARIVVVVSAPLKETARYLQAVTAFARVFSEEKVVQAVLGASSAAEAEAIVELMDVELPGSVFVGDVMSRKVRSVTPETTLAEAATAMGLYHLRSIPVVSDDGQVLGMVSSRDLLRMALPHYLRQVTGSDTRISGEGESPEPSDAGELPDPRTVAVREIMDRSVLCLTEDQTLADVASVFVNKDSDRFPVVRDGMLVGLLTRDGIVRLLFGS